MISRMPFWMFVVKHGLTLWMPFISLVYKRKSVPEVIDPLLKIAAVDLAELIRTKKITSVQLVEIFVKQIKSVNLVLNALVEDRFEAALADAKKADELCETLSEEELKTKYPLLGVPFTVTEAVGVKDMSCSMGEPSRSSLKYDEDATAINLLKAAGAIPVAVTNVPEWCLLLETYNKTTGRTLNPYNTKYSPGGSSGGEAALIAAGASVFGIGTDFSGSIRLPALFTGIFGHRPTRPLVDIAGALPSLADKGIQRTFCVGPMCRYAKDLPILMKITAGSNAENMNLDEPVDVSKLKVYYSAQYYKGWDAVEVHPEIIDCIVRAATSLKNTGADVKRHDLFKENFYRSLFCKYMEFDYTDFIEKSSIPFSKWEMIKEYFRWGFGRSGHTFNAIAAHDIIRYCKGTVTKADQIKYQSHANDLGNKLKGLLDENSVLLMPTFPTTAFKHYEGSNKCLGTSYLMIPSIFNLPATSVPLGLNKDGLPIGLQVVANEYQDRLCLAVAQHLEKEFGGWKPPKNDV